MAEIQVCNVEGCTQPRLTKGAKCLEHRREQARNYYEKNKARVKAHTDAWIHNNPEKVAEYRREYYINNRERILANNKEYRARNPEQVEEWKRLWREANEGHTYQDPSGYVNYIGYKHPVANPSGITRYHRVVLWDKLNGQDAYCHWGCGKWLEWDKKHPFDSHALLVDHVDTDKSNNDPDNLVPSCHACNVGREGGRRGTPGTAKTQVGECIVEFCDRPQKSKHLCGTHFNQQYVGREFAPIRRHIRAKVIDDHGKHCTSCDEYKPLEDFYTRNGKPKGVCKKCEVERSVKAKQARLARNIPCKLEGCEKASMTRGYCSLHYSRLYTTGETGPVDPLVTRKENTTEKETTK